MTRRALDAPEGPLVTLTTALAEEAVAASRESARRRMILPLHKSPEDALHRMFNALQPGTYVRPHRHLDPPKAELFLVLSGAIDFIVFDEGGAIAHAERLAAGSPRFGADLEAGHFHSFLVCVPDTLIYEVKPGPYTAATDKDFAAWAPEEGAAEAAAYLESLERAVAAHRRVHPAG